MRCAVLSIGTEILFGQIVNTNSAFLSSELNLLGFDVMYHHTVGDNNGRLTKLLKEILPECDMIIATGGLGPTEDDLTKETITEVFGDELVVHAESLAALEEYAKKRGFELTENNYKQTMMPSKAVVFDNDMGTAPGFALSRDGKTIICMPGPPKEMTRMWKRRVKPYLEKFSDETIYYRVIRTFGIGESSLETRLLPLIEGQTDPTIATYAKDGESTVRVASKRKSKEEAKTAVADMTDRIREIIGDKIYSIDDEDYCEAVGKELIRRNLTISACESCTGGMFSSQLINVEGISAVFDRGLVTYSAKAKSEELGVPIELIDRFGAVSPETAIEMARGLRKKTGSMICISSTGVAGPEADGDLPAGLMYVGVIYNGNEHVREIRTGKTDRNANRYYCCLCMFDEIRKIISDHS